MITKKNLETLQEIRKQEEKKGAGTAPEINTYQKRTSLYNCLKKLKKLNLLEEQEAPNTTKIEKTFTVTEIGKELLKGINIEEIEEEI